MKKQVLRLKLNQTKVSIHIQHLIGGPIGVPDSQLLGDFMESETEEQSASFTYYKI